MTHPGTTTPARFVFSLALLLVCMWTAYVEPGDDTGVEARVSVRGLRLVGKPYKGEQSMRAFNWFAGTTLALQVDVPTGGLIELDATSSTLEAMTDDKGTDLLEKGPTETKRSAGISGLAMFSEDGRAALIEVNALRTPHPEAKEIRAKGTLSLRNATVKKTYKDLVTLKKRTPVNAGPIPMTVLQVGEPDWGSEPLELTLRATQDISAITAIRFLDVKGSLILTRKLGTIRAGTLEQINFDTSFRLTKKVEVVMIEVDYWEDLRTITVPFDVKVSVGVAAEG